MKMENFEIDERLLKLVKQAEQDLKSNFEKVEKVCLFNSQKVLKAFTENRVAYQDFEEVNGYGFFDSARDKIEKVFADVLGCEDALVRPHIMSGTNAIYLTLSGLLHSGDTMICIAGAPYDPLQEIVGTRGDSPLSLMKNGVKYEEIDLINNDFDYSAIEKRVKLGGIKLIEIQRSCGYSNRKGLNCKQIKKVCKLIKSIDENIIIMCDNCYGELVEEVEPTQVGVDVIAGSLMHNLGGGIATSGGYIAGKQELIEQIADRLTAPGIGKYLGANYNQNIKFLKGLFMAPRTVANATKTAILTSYLMEKLGYKGVVPSYKDERSDIVQTFNFETADEMVKFCQSLQTASPIDSFYTPIPCEMPAYPHEEIMSAGCFAQGSTIELSCDGPVVAPYKVYMQGGLTYEYGKLGILIALTKLLKNKN